MALTECRFSASLAISPRPPPLRVLLGGIYVVQLCSGGMEKGSGKELERGQKPKVRSLSMCCVCETCLVDQSCFWLHSMNKFPGYEGKERYLINDGDRLDIWQDGWGLSSCVHVPLQRTRRFTYD